MDRQTKLKLATAQVEKREQRDTKLQETFEALYSDFAAIPTATENADAVWADSQTYSVGEKGKLLKEAADNAELSAIK